MNPEDEISSREPSRKPEMLRSHSRVREIMLSGTRVPGKHVDCSYLTTRRSGAPRARVAFLVGKASMTAVARNRFRRLMREAYRRTGVHRERDLEETALDIIFMLPPGTRTAPSYEEVRADVDALMETICTSLRKTK